MNGKVLFFVFILLIPLTSAFFWDPQPPFIINKNMDVNGEDINVGAIIASEIIVDLMTVKVFETVEDLNTTGDFNVSGNTFLIGDFNVLGDANFVNIGVVEGIYANRIHTIGSAQLGDDTTDIHGINTVPVANQMLTSSFASAATSGNIYGHNQTLAQSGVGASFLVLQTVGHFIDLDLSGTQDNFISQLENFGHYNDIDDTRTYNTGTGIANFYGTRNEIGFSGTMTDWSNYTMYGTQNNIGGNIAGSTSSTKYGTWNNVTGTAGTNVGGFFSASGATVNHGIFVSAGDVVLDNDNQKLFLGEAQDAGIFYNGVDLNIVPNEVGSGKLFLDNGLTTSKDSNFESVSVTSGLYANTINATGDTNLTRLGVSGKSFFQSDVRVDESALATFPSATDTIGLTVSWIPAPSTVAPIGMLVSVTNADAGSNQTRNITGGNITVQQNHDLTGTVGGVPSQQAKALTLTVLRSSEHTGQTQGESLTELNQGFVGGLTLTGNNALNTFGQGTIFNNTGLSFSIFDAMNQNFSGETLTINNVGILAQVNSTGSETDGTLIRTNTALRLTASNASGDVTSNYGINIKSISGAAGNNWAIFDESGANWILDADNQPIVLGEAQDSSLFYNGVDLNIVPNEVGTGIVYVDNGLQVGGNFDVDINYGSYGELWKKNSTFVIQIPTANVYIPINDWNGGDFYKNVNDPDNNSIIIGEPGAYAVVASISFTGSANQDFDFQIFANGVELPHTHNRRNSGTGGFGSVSISGLDRLITGDVVDLRVEDTTAANKNITIVNANLSVYRVG